MPQLGALQPRAGVLYRAGEPFDVPGIGERKVENVLQCLRCHVLHSQQAGQPGGGTAP